MKKTKILSLLLCLSLFCALIVPGTRAYADNEPDSGMKISKTATANADGSYTIMLEAYATGEKVISEITKDVPTDIILVLDQSGSMEDDIGQVRYTAYTGNNTQNKNNYERRHNGGSANLWHKLPNDSFVSVSVTKTTTYKELNTKLPNFSYLNECYWDYANNLYEKVEDEYKKVKLSVNKSGDWYDPTYTYTYTFADGTTIESEGDSTTPDFGSHAPLYTPAADGDSTVYTYTYTDSNGIHTIGTSIGANKKFTPAFYQRVIGSGGGSKLNALKSAVTSFVNNVNQKALGADGRYGTADDVAHRIAIVGFASNSRNKNTELLSTERATDYWSANAANYRDALVSACGTNGGVNSRLTTAIDRLDASGDTYLEYGMDMANKIFAQYPITAEDASGRQRVVVVFTDGYPAPYGTDDFKYSMANNAIQNANDSKQTYGATVYTVGVFNTADPTADIETNFATSDGWYDGLGGSGNNLTEQQEAVAANRYMHYVSSNFPGATNLNQGGSMNPNANPFAGGDSYYLSAADAGSLNNIFKQISNQIETGGSSTTLDANAEIRDVVSNAFTMPENTTDINLYTAESNGSTDSWKSRVSFNGTTSINESERTISVSGFSFKDNWCGNEETNGQTTFHDGKKLIIEFTVKPEAGFLGGNNVVTNGENSGVYDKEGNKVEAFPLPQVNVPIQDVTVTAQDKNVYLLNDVTAAQLQEGAEVTVGGVPLDLSKASDTTKPWGLEPWQTEYVDITVTVKDKDGNAIPADGLIDLTADTTYTISVTVAPITNGDGAKGTANSMDGKTGSANASINVFKPELTFKDSEVYYGADAPANADYKTNNLTDTKWAHKKQDNSVTYSTAVTMIGTAPELDLTYTPEGGKVNTKQDIAVDVAVKINGTDVTNYTTFNHTDCAGKTCTVPEGKEFLLHVKTCQLTIRKTGGADNESYVFDVYKDGDKYSEVTIEGNSSQTIYELPIGTYTISENAGWSWRYTANNGSSAELTAQNPTGSITCTNSSNGKIYWLNGFSQVVRNIFGTNH